MMSDPYTPFTLAVMASSIAASARGMSRCMVPSDPMNLPIAASARTACMREVHEFEAWA